MKTNNPPKRIVSPANKETTVQSIRRAADVLKCVSNGTNSVTEIADKCNLHKSTVHRLLKALAEADLVIQIPVTHQYYPGYQFVKISIKPAITHEFLVDCAIEEMRHLSSVTGETIDLRIKLGLKNVGLDLVQSKNDLIVVGDDLRSRPINIGVDGRVLLSQLDDEEVASVLKYLPPETATHPGNTASADLMSEINLIRRRGYAIISNELIMGVTCICAPITNYILPAVIIIVGPEIRIKPQIEYFTGELLASSARVSKRVADFQKKAPLT
jgi:DNA-binding IclR family transcriptional regulator